MLFLFDFVVIKAVGVATMLCYPRATKRHWHKNRKLPQAGLPVRFNSKIFWRKIHDRNPAFVTFNDKVKVRDWVRERVPEMPMTDLLWVGENPKDIPSSLLQAPCMIKANHGSGYNIWFDGKRPPRKRIEAKLTKWLGETFGQGGAEWAYAFIPKRALIEQKVSFPNGAPPDNINVHACNGKVIFFSVYRQSKNGKRRIGFFSAEGERLRLHYLGKADRLEEDWRPAPVVAQAQEWARVLSDGFDYVRCDFMATRKRLWFNEITTYPASGLATYTDWVLLDELQRDWQVLDSWFLTTPQRGWRRVYQCALKRTLLRRRSKGDQ